MQIAIILRTKDRPTFLRRSLQSLAEQHRLPDHVVVVNDGGSDVSLVTQDFQKFPLTLLNNPSSNGRAAAANQGVAATECQYIGFLDDDDCYHPHHLQTLAAALNGAKVAYSGCQLIDTEEQVINTFNESFDAERLWYENYIPFINLLIDRELFWQVGGLDQQFDIFEDWDLLLRLAQQTPFVHCDQITTDYMIWGDEQVTQTATGEQWQTAYRDILQKHWFMLPNQQLLDKLVDYWQVSQHRRSELKRYDSTPSIDELAEQIQTLKTANAELSQQASIGISRSTLENAALKPLHAYALAATDGGVLDDYQRLVSWHQQHAQQVNHAQREMQTHWQFLQERLQLDHDALRDELDYLRSLMSASRWHQVRRYLPLLDGIRDRLHYLRGDMQAPMIATEQYVEACQLPTSPSPDHDAPLPPPRPLSPLYPTYASVAGSVTEPVFMEIVEAVGDSAHFLMPDNPLVFSVYSSQPNFCRVDVLMASAVRINPVLVRAIVREAGNDEVLRVVYLDGMQVLDNRFSAFTFEPLADSQGKLYHIELDATVGENCGVAVWCHEKAPMLKRSEEIDTTDPALLPDWLQTGLLQLPFEGLQDEKAANTVLLAGLTSGTASTYLHVWLQRFAQGLGDATAHVTVCGQVNKAVQTYCDQHEISVISERDWVGQLIWLQNHATGEHVYLCDIHAMPDADLYSAVDALFNESCGMVVALEQRSDGKIRCGAADLLRDGVIQASAIGESLNSTQRYRQVLKAASSQRCVITRQCLQSLDCTSLMRYQHPAYQISDVIWQLQQQGWQTLYQASVRYVCDQGFDAPQTAGDAALFQQRWRPFVEDAPFAEQAKQLLPQVLIIDATLPRFDEDSASLRLFTLLKIWASLGYHIVFFPDDRADQPRYRRALEGLGIEVCHDESIDTLLREREITYTWICRVAEAHRYMPFVRLLSPDTQIFYDTVDVHYLREQRQAELQNDPKLARQAEQTKRKELSNCLLADRVITVTEEDARYLLAELPNMSYGVIPNIHTSEPVATTGFEQRDGFVFIGNYQHAPNVDAVEAFIEEVLPLLPDATFYVVGSHVPDSLRELESEQVEIVGWVDNVAEAFADRRVFVSYLRYGAGMKGKLGQAMALGLPVVTTWIGAEGMGLEDGETVLIADTAEDFAASILRLCEDQALWERLAQQGRDFIEQQYGEEAIRGRLLEVLDGL